VQRCRVGGEALGRCVGLRPETVCVRRRSSLHKHQYTELPRLLQGFEFLRSVVGEERSFVVEGLCHAPLELNTVHWMKRVAWATCLEEIGPPVFLVAQAVRVQLRGECGGRRHGDGGDHPHSQWAEDTCASPKHGGRSHGRAECRNGCSALVIFTRCACGMHFGRRQPFVGLCTCLGSSLTVCCRGEESVPASAVQTCTGGNIDNFGWRASLRVDGLVARIFSLVSWLFMNEVLFEAGQRAAADHNSKRRCLEESPCVSRTIRTSGAQNTSS
jgi:hypothetical protein